jgi:hypothetical protein
MNEGGPKVKRISLETQITVADNGHTRIKVTATPLVDGVTAEELYDAEVKAAREWGAIWQELLKAGGVPSAVTEPTTVFDHEELKS